MSESVERLKSYIGSLDHINDEDRAFLLKELKSLGKDLLKSDFKLSRLVKDKKIAENILQATIEDLEKKQVHIQQINEKLSFQKEQLKTQKKIIEEKSFVLEENLKKLELSYNEMEQFAYIASHDLKSPLRTISNFAQLVKRRNYDILDEESKEFVDFIVSGTKQMHEVICDSLEYSRVGNDDQSFDRTNLNNILDIVRFNLKKEIDENQACIQSDKLPVLSVNKTSILQLFQNLISNAIKFRREEVPCIKITCQKHGEGYEFAVSDNGAGMDEEYQHKAFLPFQRLNDRHKPGSGIGLAICKKIVKMHDGDIHFKSKRGEGTTFVFTLYNKVVSVGDSEEEISEIQAS